MLRTIIIDDERSGRQVLQQMLQKYCNNVEVVATADSAEAGKEMIDTHFPDLVFLDIEMPHENGFQLLQKFEDRNFEVVFVTAHPEYAMKAIKFRPLDYLLKPVSLAELKMTVEKAKAMFKMAKMNS